MIVEICFFNVLVDAGSATTVINNNHIELDGSETIRKAYGVGGYETILKRKLMYYNNS